MKVKNGGRGTVERRSWEGSSMRSGRTRTGPARGRGSAVAQIAGVAPHSRPFEAICRGRRIRRARGRAPPSGRRSSRITSPASKPLPQSGHGGAKFATRARQEARRRLVPESRRSSVQTRAKWTVGEMQAGVEIETASKQTPTANLRAETGRGGPRRATKIERLNLPSHEAPEGVTDQNGMEINLQSNQTEIEMKKPNEHCVRTSVQVGRIVSSAFPPV